MAVVVVVVVTRHTVKEVRGYFLLLLKAIFQCYYHS